MKKNSVVWGGGDVKSFSMELPDPSIRKFSKSNLGSPTHIIYFGSALYIYFILGIGGNSFNDS
jgi:hypothetical protein